MPDINLTGGLDFNATHRFNKTYSIAFRSTAIGADFFADAFCPRHSNDTY
ncbi:hypothetical protein [Bradyrhizobium sp. 1(2017)]|nr:hypothetical protein [Bradyrhizobium sp. 1(2017)]QIO30904.1 hypothetical protein HAP40_03205 [Bradyrhizobium sp. 1(2017)]